jgi:serine/threonine-protein kinase
MGQADPQRDIVTVADQGGRAAAAPNGDGLGPDATPSLANASALVTMAAADQPRFANFSLVLSVLALVTLVDMAAFIRHDSHPLRAACASLLVAMIVGGVVQWWAFKRKRRWFAPFMVVYFVGFLATAVVGELYAGVFSPFPCVVALTITVSSFGGLARFEIPIVALVCVTYFAAAVLVSLGIVDDPGIFAPAHASNAERLSAATLVLGVFVAAIWQARASRRVIIAAIERSNEAVLEAQRRAVQLAEANRELDAVAAADAARGGRYTGARIGSFELGPLVARGGMGEVYASHRPGDGRHAAVKLLNARALGEEALVKRFLREADITTQLHAPNIVEVMETGVTADGAPYLAMEMLAGHDLAWHLRRRTRLPIAEVVILVEQVARGLSAAHAAGVVHRDLKPANVFLHEPDPPGDPTWKILDFGVSKLRESRGTLTEGALVGTPGYMAPEQVRGETADERADVFALGAVAYRALTGQPPFGLTDVQAVFEVVFRQPTAPSALTKGLSEDVDRVIAIALEKRAEGRFSAATELADALRAASRGELPVALRARADALLRARPWGTVQTS